MYFEVFKFIVIFAGYELNPLKQVKYKTIYKMRKVSLALLDRKSTRLNSSHSV